FEYSLQLQSQHNMLSIVRFKHRFIHAMCLFLYIFFGTGIVQSQTATPNNSSTFQQSLQKIPFKDVVEEYYAYRLKDSAKAAAVINYLRSNFLTSRDENEVAETYLTLASWQKKNDSMAAALTSLDIGIEKLKRLNNKPLLFEAHNKKGSYLFQSGENEVALEHLLQAIEIAKETNNVKDEISASNNIILIKIQANDNLGAIDIYLENLQRVNTAGDPKLETKKFPIYQGLTKAYINLEMYKEASLYANEGLQLSKQMNVGLYEGYFTSFLGEIATNNGYYDKAFAHFNQAKKLIDAAGGNKVWDIFYKLYIGLNYAAQNKHEQAIKAFLESEQMLQKNDTDFLSIQDLYVGLAQSYLALENIEESSKYFKKAYEIDAKNDKTRALLNSRITRVTLDTLKTEISDLEKRSKRTKYLYAIGIGVLCIVIIGLVLYYKKQQRNNKVLFNKLMNELEEKRVQAQQTTVTATKVSQKKSATKTKEIPKIDQKTEEILTKLQAFEDKELFLSNESTLVEVAKKLQTNTTYLSKVINTCKEKSFTAYITDLRVDYAIERLSVDRKFRSFTIGAIAQEIGFKRSESFSKAFKVKTGLYPSYFIKELEKQ
ncbi:MAG: helix-turn-helix domain-containing protein, partial [Bacteroidota bacterium]